MDLRTRNLTVRSSTAPHAETDEDARPGRWTVCPAAHRVFRAPLRCVIHNAAAHLRRRGHAMGQPSLLFPLTINVHASPPHILLIPPVSPPPFVKDALPAASFSSPGDRKIPTFAVALFIDSPEPRKGNASSLSLSPSGPGAAVPRSNRDVPLPESGRRGNRDCIA